MNVSQLVSLISGNAHHNYLYHFTDVRNFPSIKEHGLLSKNQMRKLGFWPEAPSGNQWSWDADDAKGISNYVSLCATRSHPMAHIALKDERIDSFRYLAIKPEILFSDGVLFARDIANKAGVALEPVSEGLELDTEVLYSRTDWHDPSIQARLRAAEKYEFLIPNGIALDMVSKVF